MRRKDQCFMCNSRSCYTRICREEDEKGAAFDEIACNLHIFDLEQYSDTILGKKNGVMRVHISGTARQKRGESVPKHKEWV